MRHVRSIALVLLAACGGPKYGSYTHSPRAPAYALSPAAQVAEAGGDTSVHHGINPWTETAADPLSTFAADVDTASYTFARRKLLEGMLPDPAAVRVEEFVNYFRYAFPKPPDGTPFSVVMDAAPSPTAPGNHVLRIGVATPVTAERKPANLVFLVDVSGSMAGADRLPLAQQALEILTNNLHPTDSVALVTYAGSTRVALPATSVGSGRARILKAIKSLSSSGSTAMASGLDLAYEQAMAGVKAGQVSRVIVLSDGDANVGPSGHAALLKIIEGRAKAGVTLSTIGFGMGNYRDHAMEQLANKGNGNNYYIDSLDAAKRLFSDQLVSVLEVAAKDTKLQVEFDPAIVARYRLIGYENRDIADDDFRKDHVDAGEVGVGHQVTALYELQLTEQAQAAPGPLATVRIRHKHPEGETATERAYAMTGAPAASFDGAGIDLRFAFAVSAFADVLRGAEAAQRWSLDHIAAVARAAAGADHERLELVSLIEKAHALRGSPTTVAR